MYYAITFVSYMLILIERYAIETIGWKTIRIITETTIGMYVTVCSSLNLDLTEYLIL